MANSNHIVSIDLRLLTGQLDNTLATIQNQFNRVFGGINSSLYSQTSALGGFYQQSWFSVFSAVQQAGVAAWNTIGNEIERSIDYQNDLISTANSYRSLLNISFTEALGLSQKANQAFIRQSVGIPFQQFGSQIRSTFGDDFLSAFYDPKNVDRGLRQSGSLIAQLQVLFGGTTGVTNFQRQNFLSGFIGGNPLKQLQKQEVYRNNPQLQRILEANVNSLGGEAAFNSLDRTNRIRFLEKIAQDAIPKEVLKNYQQTLGAAFDSLNVALFGDVGIFSLTRDLINFIPGSSLINSLSNFFNELFRLDGIGGTILAGIQGVIDPFLFGIKFFFDGLTLVLRPINAVLSRLQILNPLIYGLSFALTTLATVGLARVTASTIRGIAIETGAALFGGGRLSQLVLLGSTFGSNASLLSSLGFARSFNFIPAIFQGIDKLADIGYLTIAGGFRAIAAGVASFGAALIPILFNPAFWAFAAAIGGIALAGYTLWKYWNPLQEFFGGFWEGFIEELKPVLALLKPFNDILLAIGEALQPIVDGFKYLGEAIAPVGSAIGGFFNGQQEQGTAADRQRGFDTGRIFGRFGLATSLTALSPGIGTVFNGLIGFGRGISNNADGSPGLLSALLNEIENKPSGSNLAIANSSEAILTESQQRNLLAGFGKGRPSITIQNLNISGSNAQGMAQEFVRTLDQLWNEAQQVYTTT